jgi:hypothetical protein
MWQALIAPVAGLFTKALDVVDKLIPDKDLAEKLKHDLNVRFAEIMHDEFLSVIQAQASVILAEVKGESWLQRNWRPLLMLVAIAIIFNNYVLAPYIGLFNAEWKLVLELPGGLWALLNLGVGGYIAGRTVEKIKGVTDNVLPTLLK